MLPKTLCFVFAPIGLFYLVPRIPTTCCEINFQIFSFLPTFCIDERPTYRFGNTFHFLLLSNYVPLIACLNATLVYYFVLCLTWNFFADLKVRELLRLNFAKYCEKPRIDYLRNDPKIDFVPLQMTHYQETMTAPESGHQHTREEIQSLIKKPLMGDILPENFFTESRKKAENSSHYKHALTDEAKEKYLNKHGNVVGVIGQAGVGKSTLSMILLTRILKENLYNADYIFYVKLRDLIDNKKMTLLHFLFNNVTSDWTKEINRLEHFLQHLSFSDSVVMILDGFDEIEIIELSFYSKIKFNMLTEESPLYFTLGLINGEILPKAKKIITSRPRQLLDLPSELKPIFIVSILGIDIQGQEQICGDICNNYKEKVWNHVQNQPELNSYCYVPVMAILIFYTILQMLKFNKPNQQTPKNITQVLTSYLRLFIDTEHVRSPINLKSLSRLAYEGIVKRKFYFCDEDFQKAELQKSDINTFLTTFHPEDQSNPQAIFKKITKKLSYFSHLIWQEFFAAICMIFYLDPKEFAETCSDPTQIKLSCRDFEVVTKFLFGLCNKNTVAILETIDKNQFTLPIETVSFLKKYLRSSLLELHYIDFSSLSDFSFWLYELNDKELTREFSNFLPNCLKMNGDVFPNNVLPFCDLIRKKQFDLTIDIGKNAYFHKNAHLLFLKEMQQIIAVSPHIKVRS